MTPGAWVVTKLKIVVHDYAGHPFQVQLSRELASRGHLVSHLYAASIQTPRGALTRRDDDPTGLEIEGISVSEPFQKQGFVSPRSRPRTWRPGSSRRQVPESSSRRGLLERSRLPECGCWEMSGCGGARALMAGATPRAPSISSG